MKKAKKLLALVLVMLLAVSLLASCGNKTEDSSDADPGATSDTATSPSPDSGTSPATSPDDTPDSGNTDAAVSDRPLNIAVSQDAGTLHPFGITGMGGFMNVMLTYMEPLYDFTANGDHLWLLATAMDYVSDINYTLKIREGVVFSNGNPLTAEDVLFSMEICRDDARVALNVKVVDFEKTKVVDDHTIDLWYTEYNASQEIGFCQMYIFDKESYDAQELALHPVGTGPYKVTDYVANSHLTVEARDDYWGQKPSIKTINYKTYNEDAQRVNALDTGEVDIAIVPLKDAEYVESLGYNVRPDSSGIALTTYYSMRPDGPLGTSTARQAVSYAIDRQSIATIVYGGLSKVVDWPLSENLVDFEPRFANMHDTYSTGYSPEKATALAEEAGLIGQKLRIITNGTSDWVTAAEIVQQNLMDIGIDSEIINYDQATYFATLMDETNFDIAIFNPASPTYLAADIFGMYLTFIPLGWTGPDCELFLKLSMDALTTPGLDVRSDMIYEYLPVFLENVPWYGLCEVVSVRVTSKDIVGLDYMLNGMLYYQYLSLK